MLGAGKFCTVGRDMTESRGTRADLNRSNEELADRIRQLDALYAISLNRGGKDVPFACLLENACHKIREGLRSPECAAVRITHEDTVAVSGSSEGAITVAQVKMQGGGMVEIFHHVQSGGTEEIFGAGEARYIEAATAGVGEMIDRVQAGEKLFRSEARFRSMSETSPMGIFMTDRNGECLYTNAKCRALWGLSFQRATGQNWIGAIKESEREAAREAWHDAIAKGANFDRVCCFTRVEVPDVWTSVRANPIWEAGEVIGFMGLVQDITQRRDAEAGALEWKNRTEAMIRASGAILYDYNPETENVHCSGNVERILGLASGEVTTTMADWARMIHPEDRAQFKAALKLARAVRGAIHMEYRIRRSDGQFVTVKEDGYPVPFPGGEGVRWIGLIEDISEKRELEEQLRHSQKMDAFGKLAGGVAHDFNNILTVISGFNEMLLQDFDKGDARREFAEEVRKAAERGSALTKQLLAFSRQQKLQPKLLDVNDVISGVEKMLRRLIGEDVTLVTNQSADLRRVKADPGQLSQVLINLAVNARDAMPQGGSLSIETERVNLRPTTAVGGAPVGWHVAIKVRDTGIGMSEDVKAQIFEPFFTTKPVGKGTGLGLATCYGIVTQSGGHIEVFSELDKGTEFRIYFPEHEDEMLAELELGAGDDLPGGNEKILVVEDEPAVRLLAVSVLKRCGYSVKEASDGADAIHCLEGIQDAELDLIITDIVMPHMGGRDLAYWVSSSHPTAKFLFTTGYPDQVYAGLPDLGCCAAFMPKPFRAETLARTVREFLDRNGETSPLDETKADPAPSLN